MPMPRKVRRIALLIHVLSSAAWFGLTLGLLALGAYAYLSKDPAVVAFAYQAGGVFGAWLLIPAALLSLLSGVVLSVGTQWGLVRHKWVLTKFVLTLITAALVCFSLTPGLREAAAQAAAGTAVPNSSLMAAPIVASSTYAFMYVLSVLKPWGETRWGRRARAARIARATVRQGT